MVVTIVSLGTGASCIYPLLGTRLNRWSFLATDIDKDSLAVAKENVARNGLMDKVKGGSTCCKTEAVLLNILLLEFYMSVSCPKVNNLLL